MTTTIRPIETRYKGYRDGRIDEYQARAAAGLPLFGRGEPRADRRRDSVCIGCGAACKFGKAGKKPAGWESRPLVGIPERELHCPICLLEWGWGDLTDPNVRNPR